MKLRLDTGITILACAALAAACASGHRRPPAVATTTAALTAPAPPADDCEIVCTDLDVVAETPRIDEPDRHAAAVADARAVIASMHEDLVACYRKGLAARPRAHGSPTFDLVIEEDGSVRKVETTGGAPLGDVTMACMTRRMTRAHFAPVYGGGTLRIHVPLILRYGTSPDRGDDI
jgi:hypothetical protein